MMTLPVINFVIFLGCALAGGVFLGWRFLMLMTEWAVQEKRFYERERAELKEEIRKEMEQAS